MAAFWVTKTDAPATNLDAACCGYGDYLYILTGNNEFWRYEPATDTWTTTLTPPSFSRNNDAAMAGYNGYLYVWGGSTVGGPNSTDLLRYNIATDTWDTTRAPMPNKQDQGGGALLNGKLYYVCGFDETSTETARLYEYDIAGNSWATKTACTSVRHNCGVAADEVNGKLYMVSGQIGSVGQVSSKVWTQSGDSWANSSNLSHSTNIPNSAEAIGSTIYLIGGFDTASLVYSAQALVLGGANAASMPRAQEYCATGVVNGKIYAVGGSDGTSYKTTYELNFAINGTGKSTTSGSASGSRSVLAADYIGQKQIASVYQVGGTSAAADTNTMVRHPRGGAVTVGTEQIGVTWQLGGGSITRVAGAQASSANTGVAGSFNINNTSGQASETDSGAVGAKGFTKLGVVGTETDTGLIGGRIWGGTQAVEVDEAVTAFVTTYYGIYRGGIYAFDSDGTVAVGFGTASSPDGITWTKHGQISGLAVNAWEARIDHPCLVSDGDILYLYYSGNTGNETTFKIGVATSTDDGVTWTQSASNPILTPGASGAWDDWNVRMPYVIYDTQETDITKRFKMWYVARKNISPAVGFSIGYAYSTDGISWTKGAGNPRLSPGVSYDLEGCMSPVVHRESLTSYRMWYGAYAEGYATANVARVGLGSATFTTPTGTYTKDAGNPLITLPDPYNAYNSALHDVTSTVNIGDTSVAVANSSDFNVDDEFYIGSTGFLDPSPNRFTLARVTSIPSGTQINFTPAATEQYVVTSAAAGHYAYLRKLRMGQLYPTSIVMIDDEPVLYVSIQGTFYSQPGGVSTTLMNYPPLGRMMALTATTTSGPFTVDHDRGVMLPLGDAATVYTHDSGGTAFDRHEADAPSAIAIQTFGQPGIIVYGGQATETDTGVAGAKLVTKVGSQATETDTGRTGAAAIDSTNGQAIESDNARAGTVTILRVGSLATDTETGAVGAPHVTHLGVVATETDAVGDGSEESSGSTETPSHLFTGLPRLYALPVVLVE